MSTAPLALSVLDLVPVRSGQTSAQAVTSSMELVRTADRLGMSRYWFAEHHNMPAVASTTPPVLVAAAAAQTERIRVGSGGVMLPNHSPLVVAEQFAALEAIAPGRVDLGLGRAPGSDPVITHLLRRSGTTSEVERFPEHVNEILALLSPDGAALQFDTGGTYTVNATPVATSTPEVWLLGSSDYSARLAASLGLPYVFAHHFSGHGVEQALEIYRGQFQPSQTCPAPRTFLTVNAVAAPTAEEAEARSLPNQRIMAKLRLGQPLTPLETVEQSQAAIAQDGGGPGASIMASSRATWFVGTGADVASELTSFAAKYDVDEVMIAPVAGAYDGEDPNTSPGRTQTLELISAAL